MRRMLYQSSRAKSGMATVLGMLIFIGVIFTCVIPLFLYVNQVNSIYDQAVFDMRHFDQMREEERIDVYAYPLKDLPDQLKVYIKNKSPLSVSIVRVWVNDQPFELSFEIPAMEERTIESVTVTLPTGGETKPFNIKVTTRLGRIFPSLTNTLYYTSGDGGWSGGTGFTIHIVIETSKLGTCFYHLTVTNDPSTQTFTYEADVIKKSQESSCFTVVTVPLQGTYLVTVIEKQGGGHLVTDKSCNVDLNNPSAWVYVTDPE